MRYFADIEFDGTAYSGWQIQPHSPSVQQTLEEALALFLRQKVGVTGAGRTDAGVHAAQMIAHFDLDECQDCEWINVRPDAHARFDAVSRTYKYYVTLEKSAFQRNYSWYLLNEPDFELMTSAA